MAGSSPSDVLTGSAGTTSPGAILDLCDRLLEEVGRRQHRFAWLRAPGAPTGDWLPVDAYYPARRVVVICPDEASEDDGLFDELIPAHGLRLLRIVPGSLGSDPEPVLAAQIAALELPPREIFDLSVGAAPVRVSPIARVSESLVQATAPPSRPRVRRTPRVRRPGGRGSPCARRRWRVGVVVGVALAIVFGIELFVGVGEVALGGDHWLLAFGLALDVVGPRARTRRRGACRPARLGAVVGDRR